ncbi:MAG: M23 family metallopeptidase [Patescibacteria group bacterium]
MKRILVALISAVLFTAAIGLIQGCSERPTEPIVGDVGQVDTLGGREVSQTASKSAATWPTSMSDFKFPFAGVYNNYHAGQIWKITNGYNSGRHKNWYYPYAGYYSIDLERDDGGASLGSYVLAPARGVVVFAGWMNGYGWCVVMDHDAGHTGSGYKSIEAHLQSDPTRYVNVGDDLLQGTLLGKCGSSGGDWGPHIHFSVWKNNRSVPLNGISGGPGLIVGGRYCSGNAAVRPPGGW